MHAPKLTTGVSVVVVNWNTRDKVLRLLGDLSRPVDGLRLELIVVDNHSSDGSVEAIRRAFPSARLIAQDTNRGFAGGVNPGVAEASEPFVLLLNSDLRAAPEAIAAMAQYLDEHPRAGLLGPRVVDFDGQLQVSCWRDPSLLGAVLQAIGLSKLRAFDVERYRDREIVRGGPVDCVSGCALMVRRDVWRRLGGLDEAFFMYFEETDLCLRARRQGSEVHYAPVAEVVHERGGASGTVRLRTFLDFRRSEILYHRKHRGRLAAAFVRAWLSLGCANRILPLALLSIAGGARKAHARSRLVLQVRGLEWLLQPRSGLVPHVDRPT